MAAKAKKAKKKVAKKKAAKKKKAFESNQLCPRKRAQFFLGVGNLLPVDKKRRAAEAALGYIEDGMVLGIGTGSTVTQLIEALKDRKIQLSGAISSSRQTSDLLAKARIPELDLNADGPLA